MKKTILIVCTCLGTIDLKAQSAAKAVYAELGGPGLAS